MGIRVFAVIEIGENGTFVMNTKVYTDSEVARAAARQAGMTDGSWLKGVVTAVSGSEITFAFINVNTNDDAILTLKLAGQSLVWDANDWTFAKGVPNPNRR